MTVSSLAAGHGAVALTDHAVVHDVVAVPPFSVSSLSVRLSAFVLNTP
jgi:hypothetical protein